MSRLLGSLAFQLVAVSVAVGQVPADTQWSVIVTDATGGALVGATCSVESPEGDERLVVAAADGRCRLGALVPGAQRVRVELPGFDARHVELGARSSANGELTVVLEPARVAEEVVVSAVRVPTPVSTLPNTVTILPQTVIESRTSTSDDLASLLAANVTGFGPSLKKLTGRGESLRGRNPLYTVNGVPQHTPLRDGERDGHTIDLDFLERVEVVHGSNAIQGIGATGGIVNLVTKSPRSDGRWTHDVRLSVANGDGFETDGWSSKLSYLLGKRVGKVAWIAGVAAHQRGLFFDANGRAIGLYPTQGDIMDSTSRAFYGKVSIDATANRRLEIALNDFTLARDGDFVPVPGNRARGLLTTSVAGDPRATVGEPARNDTTTVSVDYRDKRAFSGELSLQAYAQDYEALFEGGTFTTFALTPGGPAYLDQSAITSRKLGAKATWTMAERRPLGFIPTLGFDLTADTSAQVLARTGRTWVPEMTLTEAAPFVQLQRPFTRWLLVSGGIRASVAELRVDDFTTLPSARSTRVGGGRPSFTEVLPNVGAVFYARPSLSFFASFSEGFTMPDVGRVLRAVNVPGQDVDTLVDVEPVVAGNLEVGVDYRLGDARFHGAYYRSVADRGSLLEQTADSRVFAVRREKTAIDGIDVTASVPIAATWSAGTSVSWLRGRFDTNRDGRVDTDMDGLNVSPGRVNLYVDGQPRPWLTTRLQLSALRGRTVEGLAPPARGARFGGYTLADLAVGVPLKAGTFRLAMENLLDKQYVLYFSQVDTAGANDTLFAGQGRSFLLSFERRF